MQATSKKNAPSLAPPVLVCPVCEQETNQLAGHEKLCIRCYNRIRHNRPPLKPQEATPNDVIRAQNGHHVVALIAGAEVGTANHLRQMLAASLGIEARYHWEQGRTKEYQRAIPKDVDLVISITDATTHREEGLLRKQIKRTGVPAVRTSKNWTAMRRALAQRGFRKATLPISGRFGEEALVPREETPAGEGRRRCKLCDIALGFTADYCSKCADSIEREKTRRGFVAVVEAAPVIEVPPVVTTHEPEIVAPAPRTFTAEAQAAFDLLEETDPDARLTTLLRLVQRHLPLCRVQRVTIPAKGGVTIDYDHT